MSDDRDTRSGPMSGTYLGMPAFPEDAATPYGTRSCGSTSATPRTPSATSGPRAVAELADWDGAARRPARRSRTTPCATWTATCSSWRRRSPRRAAPCTGRPTPTRPTGSSPTWCKATGETEVVKVKSMATQEIGLNEALAGGGHHRLRDRPGRADRAARRRPALAHPGPGDPPEPRARSATSSSTRWPTGAARRPRD